MSRGQRYVVGGIVAIVAVVTIIAVGVVFILRQLDQAGEATAQFIPASAPFYASINLRPGVGQINQAREFMELLRTDEFIDRQDDMLDEIEDETGIHFLDDVTDWLGTHVSFAVLDDDLEEPEWIVLVQISDREAATVFADDFASYLEEEMNIEFESDDHKRAELWEADDDEVALGVTDEYLLMGDSEDTLEDIIDSFDSPPTRPLSEDETFVAARESVPPEWVMFAFARTGDLFDEIVGLNFGDLLDETGMGTEDADEIVRQIEDAVPDYVAASLSFVESGVRMDVVAQTPSGAMALSSENELRSADVLPVDTLLLISGVGVRDGWEELKDTLRDLGPEAEDELEMFLIEFEDSTGINLERDVVESLSAEIAFAVLPSIVRIEGEFGGLSGTIESLLLADIADPRGIRSALDALADVIEEQGIDIDRESRGENQLVTADLGGLADMLGRYEPGYMITDDWAVLGSNVDGIGSFHSVLTGQSDALSTAHEFSRLVDMAPSPLHFLLFADLAGIIATVEDALPGDLRSEYRREVQPLIEPLSTFMMAGSTTEQHIRYIAVLTLRE